MRESAAGMPRLEGSYFKKARQILEYGLARLGFWLAPRLPDQLLLFMGRVLGGIAYRFSPAMRNVALANLEVVYGPKKTSREKNAIARQSFQSFARTTMETLAAPGFLKKGWQHYAEFSPGSLERLNELMSRKKGLLALTYHLGNWEWLSLAWGAVGFPVTAVAQRIKNPLIETLYRSNRELTGHRLLNRRHAARQLYKTLRRGEIVGLLVDLNSGTEEGGAFFDFFGLPALSTRSVGLLALRTGAPIVCSTAICREDGRYQIEIGPEIVCDPNPPDDEQEMDRITRAWLRHCESKILEHPGQWMWMYKRWKVRPEAEVGRYPFYSFYKPVD